MKHFLTKPLGTLLLLILTFSATEARPPNVVVIFLDDAGWADFEPFGLPAYKTPHVRQLAKEGRRFNQFYVPQAICSASRAALLSGSYPGRTKVFGAHGPNGRGLEPKFMNIAEMLKQKDYRTGIFGKWHVGDQPETRPAARGFDESAGLMYSNDMWEFHPENPGALGQVSLTILREQPSHHPARDQRAPALPHDLVHGESRRFHRPSQRVSILSLRPPLHATRASLREREVCRQVRSRTLWRRHDGDRLVGRADQSSLERPWHRRRTRCCSSLLTMAPGSPMAITPEQHPIARPKARVSMVAFAAPVWQSFPANSRPDPSARPRGAASIYSRRSPISPKHRSLRTPSMARMSGRSSAAKKAPPIHRPTTPSPMAGNSKGSSVETDAGSCICRTTSEHWSNRPTMAKQANTAKRGSNTASSISRMTPSKRRTSLRHVPEVNERLTNLARQHRQTFYPSKKR